MASWLDALGDAASDFGTDALGAAGDYLKGKVKSALPDTQPATHTGETGKGGTSAVPAGQTQQSAQPTALPKWVLPAAAATGAVLVLGVVVALVRR